MASWSTYSPRREDAFTRSMRACPDCTPDRISDLWLPEPATAFFDALANGRGDTVHTVNAGAA